MTLTSVLAEPDVGNTARELSGRRHFGCSTTRGSSASEADCSAVLNTSVTLPATIPSYAYVNRRLAIIYGGQARPIVYIICWFYVAINSLL